MSITETFSKYIEVAVINEYDKAAVRQISTVLWHVYHVACSKFCLDFKNAVKNWKKVLCYGVFASELVIVSINKSIFFIVSQRVNKQSQNFASQKERLFLINCFASDQWIWERWCDADFNIAYARLPCSLSKGSSKRGFWDISLTTFSECVIWRLQNLSASIFLSKILSKFQKCSKKSRKSFVFLR